MKGEIRVVFLFCMIISAVCACSNSKEESKLQLIIDADTANEVDDLFAIVRALVEPKFNVLAITSAQFHTSPLATDTTVLESQRMNEDIIRLMGRQEIPLPLGSNTPLFNKNLPAESEATDFIIEKAHEMRVGQFLNLLILGSCTNVASAILKDPTIVPKIRVHYIGFWHDVEQNIFDRKEFNSGNDSLAVEVLLNIKGLDFDVMTATTCQHLVFNREDTFKKLGSKGEVGNYLTQRWKTYHRWWTNEDPEKEKWIMWDVAIIEALAYPEFAEKHEFKLDLISTRSIDAYTSIDVDAMRNEFWSSIDEYL